MTFRVLSLFAGIGGFDLGLERTGAFKTVAFCEIDKKAQQVLRKHWPEVPIYDDVRTVTRERLAADGVAVDFICGGFPCQDISYAGRGAGLAGERSGLFYEVARLIGELEPRGVLLENVSALLTRGLGDVLGTLASLGYDAQWHCIPASAVGAPHRRDRIWILAHPGRARVHERRLAGDASQEGAGQGRVERDGLPKGSGRERAPLAHADSEGHNADAGPGRDSGEAGQGEIQGHQRQRIRPSTWGGSATVPDAYQQRLEGWLRAEISGGRAATRYAGQGGWWFAEPDVGRVAHGVRGRVDRLKQLGNAVVPQIPEIIGRALVQAIEARSGETTQIGSTEGKSAVAKPCTERKAA